MALLPIYQAIYHLRKKDEKFAKELSEHFKDRLDVFLSYCHEEGWALEYDGADPGYLSATLSFLSKMQRYMTGNENWAGKIQTTIDRAIKFTSYFFYPNGSYAGTVGSRQTLHFYAHGYELQAKHNPLAAAQAEFGLKSLSQDKLVPPGIQDDRYYLYRIPEFLEAYLDYRERPASLPALPCQTPEPFDKYFTGSKIFIKNYPGHYAVLNLAKGGVLKVFDKKPGKLVFADDGLVARQQNGKVLTTQWIGAEYRVKPAGNQYTVNGSFHKIPYKYFTPATFIAFRTFMLLTGWNARLADWIKGAIRSFLMTRSSKSKMTFERKFIFENNKITVANTINTSSKISYLRIGGQFASRYVPQSRYFQQEELENKYWDLQNPDLASPIEISLDLTDNKIYFSYSK